MAGCGCGCGHNHDHDQAHAGQQTSSTTTATLNIEGMSCAHCAGAVQRSLAALDGVKDVTVDVASKKAMVTFEPGKVGNDDFKQAVENAGYQMV